VDHFILLCGNKFHCGSYATIDIGDTTRKWWYNI